MPERRRDCEGGIGPPATASSPASQARRGGLGPAVPELDSGNEADRHERAGVFYKGKSEANYLYAIYIKRETAMQFKNLEIEATCISCGQIYTKDLEGMLKTCTECGEVIKKYFDKKVGWTEENLKIVCNEIISKKIKELPNESTFRRCRFCGRMTDMFHGIMVSAPDFCPKCWQRLGSNLSAEGYLSLISK